MKMPSDSVVVVDISGNTARLYSDTESYDEALIEAGFLRSGSDLTRPISDNADRQHVVRTLIGIDALFSSGRDWSPEDIVEMFKEQGLSNQSYHVISWRNPETYSIFTR